MDRPVLIIDDDAQICKMLGKFLSGHHFDATTVQSGLEGVEAVRNGFRGLILLDVHMDGMSGWDVIRTIADENLIEGNLVVMLTGDVFPQPEMDHLKEYILDYITKPIDLKTFIPLINSYFDDYLNQF